MLGLLEPKIVKRLSFKFSEIDKRKIVEDYLQSDSTKQAIWEKHTGRSKEHGKILDWMRRYGYIPCDNAKIVNFATNLEVVKPDENSDVTIHEVSEIESDAEFDSSLESEIDVSELRKRNSQLEKQLRESELKSLAWQTMIEIAEREYNIDIKKKVDTRS